MIYRLEPFDPEKERAPSVPEKPGLSKLEIPTFPVDFSDAEVMFRGGPRKRTGLKLALWTWLSASIDGLILFSSSCFFMFFFAFLMKTSAKSFLQSVFSGQHGLIIFSFLFLIVSWSYLIFSRAYMGASIGEHTCGLRLGQPIERRRFSYVFKVFIRSSVIILTGVFTLPILSAFMKRDLAGDLSGVHIYSLH